MELLDVYFCQIRAYIVDTYYTNVSSCTYVFIRDGEDLQQQSLGQMMLLTECTASFGSWTSSTSRLWMTRKVSQNKFTTGSW